jgi:hypothetical protein
VSICRPVERIDWRFDDDTPWADAIDVRVAPEVKDWRRVSGSSPRSDASVLNSLLAVVEEAPVVEVLALPELSSWLDDVELEDSPRP